MSPSTTQVQQGPQRGATPSKVASLAKVFQNFDSPTPATPVRSISTPRSDKMKQLCSPFQARDFDFASAPFSRSSGNAVSPVNESSRKFETPVRGRRGATPSRGQRRNREASDRNNTKPPVNSLTNNNELPSGSLHSFEDDDDDAISFVSYSSVGFQSVITRESQLTNPEVVKLRKRLKDAGDKMQALKEAHKDDKMHWKAQTIELQRLRKERHRLLEDQAEQRRQLQETQTVCEKKDDQLASIRELLQGTTAGAKAALDLKQKVEDLVLENRQIEKERFSLQVSNEKTTRYQEQTKAVAKLLQTLCEIQGSALKAANARDKETLIHESREKLESCQDALVDSLPLVDQDTVKNSLDSIKEQLQSQIEMNVNWELKYEDVWGKHEHQTEVITGLQSAVNEWKQLHEEDAEIAANEMEELRKTIQELEDDLDTMETAATEVLQKRLADRQNELDAARAKEEEILKKLEKEKELAESLAAEKKQLVTERRELLEQLVIERRELLEQCDNIKAEKEEIEIECKQLRNQTEMVELKTHEQVGKMQGRIENLEDENRAWLELQQLLEKQNKVQETKISDLENKLATSIKETKAAAQVMKNELEQARQRIVKAECDRDQLENERGALANKLSETQERLSGLVAELEELKASQSHIGDEIAEKERLQDELEQARQRIDKAEIYRDQLENERDALSNNLNETQERISGLLAELEELKASQSQIGDEIAEKERLQDELEQAGQRIDKAECDRDQLENERDALSNNLNETQERISGLLAELEELKASHSQIGDEIAEKERLQDELKISLSTNADLKSRLDELQLKHTKLQGMLEKYEMENETQMTAKSREYSTKLKSLEDKNDSVMNDLRVAEERIVHLVADLEESKEYRSKATLAIAEKERLEDELKAALSSIERLNTNLEELKQKRTNLQGQIYHLQAEKERHKTAESELSQEYSTKLASLEIEKITVTNDLNTAEERIAQLMAELEESQSSRNGSDDNISENERLRDELKESLSSIENLNAEIAGLRQTQINLQELINKLETEKEVLETAKNELSQKYSTRLKSLEGENDELTNNLSAAEERISELLVELEESKESQSTVAIAEKERLQEELKESLSSNENLQATLMDLHEKEKALEGLIHEHEKEKEMLRVEKDELSKEYATKLKSLEHANDLVTNNLNAAEEQISHLVNELDESKKCQRRIVDAIAAKERLENQMKELFSSEEDLKVKLEALQKQKTDLEELVEMLQTEKENQNELAQLQLTKLRSLEDEKGLLANELDLGDSAQPNIQPTEIKTVERLKLENQELKEETMRLFDIQTKLEKQNAKQSRLIKAMDSRVEDLKSMSDDQEQKLREEIEKKNISLDSLFNDLCAARDEINLLQEAMDIRKSTVQDSDRREDLMRRFHLIDSQRSLEARSHPKLLSQTNEGSEITSHGNGRSGSFTRRNTFESRQSHSEEPSYQGALLQSFLDKKQKQQGKQSGGIWNLRMFGRPSKLKDSTDCYSDTDDEERMEMLREENKLLKSELVRLRSSFKDELYSKQKIIRELKSENDAIKLKNEVLSNQT